MKKLTARFGLHIGKWYMVQVKGFKGKPTVEDCSRAFKVYSAKAAQLN